MGVFSSKAANPYRPMYGPAYQGLYDQPITTPTTGTSSTMVRTLMAVAGSALLIYFAVMFYNYIQRRNGLPGISLGSSGSTGDQVPEPVDAKTRTVISSTTLPSSSDSYGLQFWMYVSDWDYKFSSEKNVVKRVDPVAGGINSPVITLHPTDNSLNVRVAVYPNTPSGGTAAAPTSSSTGDSFTCTVENVPLQTWFAVSVTVFQRNLDIYINGRLVKSCVLPGVPRPVVGDIIIGDNGGFSGSVCNLHAQGSMLSPEEAKSFFEAGTNCAAPTPSRAAGVDANSPFITLFGYTFRFTTLDKLGKEISSYTF